MRRGVCNVGARGARAGRLTCAAVLLVCAALPVATRALVQTWAIDDPGQGPVMLASGTLRARELSGLTWAQANRYYAVSDKDGRLFRLSIDVEPANGTIRRAAIDEDVDLAQARDAEGVAMGSDETTVFVTDEVGPALREYRISDGRLLRSARVPGVFSAERTNLGFESLTRDADGALWTANEDALKVDGPTSSASSGSVVRLQRFDSALRPTGQWAYRLDSVDGQVVVPNHGTGLSDLVALPDGGLMALERSLGMSGLRIRLYELDLRGATDVSQLPGLLDAHVNAVKKRLLWERTFLRENYEGAALGPTLANGSRSLLLISDDGHDLAQTLYALRLTRRSHH